MKLKRWSYWEFMLAGACAAFFWVGSPPAVGQPDGDGNWTITGDARLVGGSYGIEGNLTISSGATLELRGTKLQVGGRILVEDGGSLDLGPYEESRTVLGPLNKTALFWIEVNGTVRSGGTPTTIVEGLEGSGFGLLAMGEGGVHVNGVAQFEDLQVRNSTAGVLVNHGGSAVLHRVLLEQLGFAGLVAMGPVVVQDSHVSNNTIGLMGRNTCEFKIRNTSIHSHVGNIQLNGCPALIESSTLEGGRRSIFSNAALLRMSNASLTGYTYDGLAGSGATTYELFNVTLTAGRGAENGIDVRGGSSLKLESTTVEHHAGDGVFLSDSRLTMHSSRLWANGGFGVRGLGGKFENDLAGSNDFGTLEGGTQNSLGPVSKFVYTRAKVVDEFWSEVTRDPGRALPGLTLEVQRASDGAVVFAVEEARDAEVLVAFETFDSDADGRPRWTGPFTYVATHPSLQRPFSGTVPEDSTSIVIFVPAASDASPLAWRAVAFAAMITAGLLLVGYAVLADRLKRLVSAAKKK